MLKKCDISINEISMCIGRIETVTMLKTRITKEDALRCLSRKFILGRSKYVDKTSASCDAPNPGGPLTTRQPAKSLVNIG